MADECKPMGLPTFCPERIVSLSPSSTEILFAVGAGPKIVGVTDHCNYPPSLRVRIEADKIKKVGGYWNPSVKSIRALKPDLVLLSTIRCTQKRNECKMNCRRRCEIPTTVANQLRSSGVNVLTLTPHSMEDVLNNILMVGKTIGNTAEADILVQKLRQRIDSVVAESKADFNTPKVYFEVWNNPYMTVSSETWIDDLIRLAGGTNVFSEVASEWPIITPEEVVQRNPDVMFFPVVPRVPRFWRSFEAVKNRSGWESINAVRSGHLYEIPRDLISRPGPRLVEALEMMAEMIHKSS